MKDDNVLSSTEVSIDEEMKENYIVNYATLVADNIATYYKYYGNEIKIPLQNIKRMSKDDYLIDEDSNKLNCLIVETLKSRHNLKLTSKHEDNHLNIEKFKVKSITQINWCQGLKDYSVYS